MPFITQGKANLKYILIVVILAAIVGGGVLVYQYWWLPKQEAKTLEIKPPVVKDETASWEIYSDSDIGIGFKYPKNWYLNKKEIIFTQLSGPSKEGSQHIYGNVFLIRNCFEIIVSENPFDEAYPTYRKSIEMTYCEIDGGAKHIFSNLKQLEGSDKNVSVGKIGGLEVVKVIDKTPPDNVEYEILFTIKGDRSFTIINFLFSESQEYKEIFTNFISTFKFIEEDETTNCAKDEDCGGKAYKCIGNKCTYSFEECVDSDAECKGKPDGVECTIGVWCDEYGKVCGGQSCVGFGVGRCSGGECLSLPNEDFCGSSTRGSCASNSGCMTGGCSGQI